jgi:hypothetical protein
VSTTVDSAAVESSTTATMETAAAESSTAMEAAANGPAGHRCAMNRTMVRNADWRTANITGASVVTAASIVAPTSVVAAASIIAATIIPRAVEAMEPRASADKDSTHKPLRAVVAVGSASIGVIAIVAVVTNRRDIASVPRSYPNANHDLCVGRSCCRKHANCKQS